MSGGRVMLKSPATITCLAGRTGLERQASSHAGEVHRDDCHRAEEHGRKLGLAAGVLHEALQLPGDEDPAIAIL
eukprot:6417742-Lingulodinium_polyedra.AAC.1